MQRVDIVETNLAFGNLQERSVTDMIVIHHTGNPTDRDITAAEIHQSHLAIDMSGIGYHYVVRKDGTVERGRPDWAVGGHAYGENWHTIGIHLSGNFEIGTPTEAQIEKAAMLLATICADYGIPIDRAHIVGHRELMATACPGANLFARLDEIVGKANWYANEFSKNEQNCKSAASTFTKSGDFVKDTESRIWQFLKGKGLNDYAVAGIMGNLFAESELNPTYYNQKLGMTDEEYTHAVDAGTYENFIYDKAGYGLAQWTYYSRKEKLLNFARLNGVSIGNLDMQLDFLWQEFSGYTDMMATLQNATSVLEASNAVLLDFERPADQSEQMQERRANYGVSFFDKYALPKSSDTGNDAAQKQQKGTEEMRYDTVDSLPEWARATIIKLMDKGLINNDGTTLDLSHDMLRLLVINDRAGLYD